MINNQNIGIARNISYKVLYDVYYNGAYSNLSIKKHFKALKRDEDKSLASHIIFGTLKKDIYLSNIIKKLSSIEYDKIKPEILLILKAGIYQLYFLDRVPAYACVNDSVNIAKFYVSKKTASFVNAVLRSAVRQKKDFTANKKDSDIPLWLIKYLGKYFDDEFLYDLEQDFLKSPEMYIRVNKLKSTEEEVFNSLNDKSANCEKTFLPDVFKVLKPANIIGSELMKKNIISIQDLSSALCAYVLDVKENEKVIDLCAAPGGKSLHIASLTGNRASLYACDVAKQKVEYMQNIFKDFGADIEVIKNDAEMYREDFADKFDKVLADVPCSGLGVIGRKPEILLRLNIEGIKILIEIQKNILNNAAKYVKKGGILVYSTCSINPEENELQIKEFLSKNKDFSLSENVITDEYGKYLNIASKGEIKLYSQYFTGDGFYICKMLKK